MKTESNELTKAAIREAVSRVGREEALDWQSVDALLDGEQALLEAGPRVCHTLARNAGWWSNLETGEPIHRDHGEVFALIHSEVSEALEGWRKGLQDDHLSHRPMVEVELADTLIRIFDYAGSCGCKLSGRESCWGSESGTTVGQALALIHADISRAYLEYDPEYTSAQLSRVCFGVLELGKMLDLDVPGALVEKLAYNLDRADHKREARLAAGGKKC